MSENEFSSPTIAFAVQEEIPGATNLANARAVSARYAIRTLPRIDSSSLHLSGLMSTPCFRSL